MTDLPRKRSGLGRGLSSLLGEMAQETSTAGSSGAAGVQMLPVASLDPDPTQPRRHFDEEALAELAASIQSRGLIQPIVVRPKGSRYQIVAGERRWRAAQKAQLHDVPVIVRELDDSETFELAILENIQRQDLNAIEEGYAYLRLINEFGHTQEELGRLVHKSRSHVANLLRILDLPQRVQGYVAVGQLSMGHARALVTSTDPQSLADEVIRRGLSVRDTERLAKAAKPRKAVEAPVDGSGGDADIAALERQLGDLLGLKVTIAHAGGAGTVTLGYSSLDQLDMICQRLSGERI